MLVWLITLVVGKMNIKKLIIWIVVLTALTALGIYLIFGKGASDDTDTTNTDQTQEETTDEDTTDTDTSTDEEEDTTDSSTTPTGFTSDDKTLGENSESKFTIEEVSQTSKTTYHEFVFTLSTTGENEPFVEVKYVDDLGVLRVDLNNVEADESGIGYQKEVSIDKDGIVRLYHNISSDQTEELYDIGVSKEPTFTLTSAKVASNWEVTVNVAYPGASTATIDLGSTEYSISSQDITGVDSTNNASIKGYTYSTSGGVLTFVWTVDSDDENPIPSVTASYDSSNVLSVTFSSLSLDKVVSAVDELDLPGGLTMDSSRSGSASTYNFMGLTSQREFKLSATTSPNQVILEIDL